MQRFVELVQDLADDAPELLAQLVEEVVQQYEVESESESVDAQHA
jgi:hypothetical protein